MEFWVLPCLIALYHLPAGSFSNDIPGGNVWNTFAVTTVLLSYPSPHAIHVSWASRNSNAVRTRAISTAVYNMGVQLSRVIYANIYREDDRPVYRRGNRVLIAICCMNVCIYLLGKGYYMWRNKTKAQQWDNMTKDVSVSLYILDGCALADLNTRSKNITLPPPPIPEASDSTSDYHTRRIQFWIRHIDHRQTWGAFHDRNRSGNVLRVDICCQLRHYYSSAISDLNLRFYMRKSDSLIASGHNFSSLNACAILVNI